VRSRGYTEHMLVLYVRTLGAQHASPGQTSAMTWASAEGACDSVRICATDSTYRRHPQAGPVTNAVRDRVARDQIRAKFRGPRRWRARFSTSWARHRGQTLRQHVLTEDATTPELGTSNEMR